MNRVYFDKEERKISDIVHYRDNLLDGVFIITGELDIITTQAGLFEIWLNPSWTTEKYNYQQIYLDIGENTATFSIALLVKPTNSFKIEFLILEEN